MKLIPIFIIICCLYACDKSDVKGDLSGNEQIRGRLFLYDTITQNAKGNPLSNKTVYISYAGSTDSLNYLFSAKTDEQGYFIFKYLKSNTLYRIYFEEQVNDIIYRGVAISKASTDTLRINASLAYAKQNGIYYIVTDASGGVVKGARICIFSNEAAYKTGSCEAANYSITSDELGRASKFNMVSGTYFVIASVKINDLTFSIKDTISVSNSVVSKKIILAENKVNGFKYTVLDTIGYRISGANLCVFTSQVLFNRDSCSGSNFQVTSDINGVATKTDLQPGRYLIYGYFQHGDNIYYARDTINIGNAIISDTLKLRRKY